MGKSGYTFRVWAPNAQSVHLIGDFTDWYENQIPMARNEGGVHGKCLRIYLRTFTNTTSNEVAGKKF